MITTESQTTRSQRYERKFVVTQLDAQEIEHLLKLHPAIFSEVFHQRYVNNIYIDSHDLKNYWDNVCGAQNRIKVRTRWYDDLFGSIAKPTLELKIKNGFVNWKESYPLEPFTLDKEFRFDSLLDCFEQSNISQPMKIQLNSREPALLNRYRRKYFLSVDRSFRVTVDTEMEYMRISKNNNVFMEHVADHRSTIVELKYDPDKEPLADTVSGYFPFRVTKSSKYVKGIEALNQPLG